MLHLRHNLHATLLLLAAATFATTSGCSSTATTALPAATSTTKSGPTDLNNSGTGSPASAASPSVAPTSVATAPLTETAAVTMAAQDAAKDPNGANARYFSIAYLQSLGFNGPQQLVVRIAVAKLLNSLSWTKQVIAPSLVNGNDALLKIYLQDYGWTPAMWETLVAQHPSAAPSIDGLAALQAQTGSSKPVIRAEFFIENASIPPLYYQLLNLTTVANLETQLGAHLAADLTSDSVIRAGIDNSLVATNDRVIERHAAPTGFIWRTYEFGTKATNQDIFSFPLGPAPASSAGGLGAGSAYAFAFDGSEFLFALPNGMLAFFISDATGNQLAQVPGSPKKIVPGQTCMGCHSAGPINTTDKVAATVAAQGKITGAALAEVQKIYIDPTTFNNQVNADAATYQKLLLALGMGAGAADPINTIVQLNVPEN